MALAAIFAALAVFGAAAGPRDRDVLLNRCLHQLHSEQFEEALATADQMRRQWPDDAVGYLAGANVHQTRMRDYRVKTGERAFRTALKEALEVAERSVQARPTTEALFARGTARAYQAVHSFSSGDWVRGVLDALKGVSDARRAYDIDPSFVDPVLALAVHDFWKAEKLGLGLGLFAGGRRTVVSRLERVRTEARFLSVEAGYALQTVHYLQGDLPRALDANEWLHRRFPSNPIGLYHRGLILEGMDRDHEALSAWNALLLRLQGSPHRSDGFLAECQLHRARLLGRVAGPGDGALRAAAAEALLAAARHAAGRVAERELEGPLVSFAEIQKAITRLATSARPAPAAGGE